jgi:hypothetical protein
MDKHLGKDITNRKQRESYLKDNCEKVENKGYMKPFTPEQLQGHKENLADLSIEIERIEDEKKASARYYKTTLDPLTEQRREMVFKIRQKAEYVNELCYKFVDRDERMTGYYNADGDLIELRPATADELQPTLFAGSRKTGTDD